MATDPKQAKHTQTTTLGVESAEHEIRKEKVAAMRRIGIEPWPAAREVSDNAAAAHAAFVAGNAREMYTLAGRIVTIRKHGKTLFATMQDMSGKIQLYLKKDAVDDTLFAFFVQFVDIGDILWVRGPLFATKTGEVTVKVEDFALLSKCLHPLPDKFHGIADVELRYRQRYLDLIGNEQTRARFVQRSRMIQQLRDDLVTEGFIEVETPMLHPIPGGAVARPFVTHHNAYDIDLYLRIAPELYLKRLVVGGFERVFEINRNFRNEGVSTKHNPEFTMLELYMAHADYNQGMALTESLVSSAIQHATGGQEVTYGEHTLSFAPPFARFTVAESLIHFADFTEAAIAPKQIDATIAGLNLSLPRGVESYGQKLFFLFEACVEDKIVQPTFITGHPIEVSPLAKRDPENPAYAARFELFVAGMELANSFSELNDPLEQAARFREQAVQRAKGADEAHYYDVDYVHALEYGLPPTVGIGIGIDRLVMLATNTRAIKDVILFPTMKQRLQ